MKNGKHVILYIDDDPDFLDTMRVLLNAHGYEMADAATAEEGLKAYQEANPDLIIVDLMMEEVDAGAHFVKDLKAKGCNVPIYMLSSVGDNLSMSTDVTELGLDGVLQKPINPDHLVNILKTKLK
jgi:DNA-binding response OmpR family regulator